MTQGQSSFLAVDWEANWVKAIAALREAIELADEGWSYADDYFRSKWEYVEERNRLAKICGMPQIEDY